MNTRYVQVGWYCNHEDEMRVAPYKSSHMSSHGKWVRSKWVEGQPEPHTSRGLQMLDYHEPKREPHCQRAVPVYIEEVTR